MGRLYNVTPPCPYCGEEHVCWTIRLTDREQEILDLATLKYILYSKGKSTENRKYTIFNAFLVIPHTDLISIL